MLGVAAGRVDGYRYRVVGLGGGAGATDLGHPWLDGVVRDTEDALTRDMQGVAQVLDGLSVFLRSAAATYRSADQHLDLALNGDGA